jgi:hypothetical protein
MLISNSVMCNQHADPPMSDAALIIFTTTSPSPAGLIP